jgi:hypothetical protein
MNIAMSSQLQSFNGRISIAGPNFDSQVLELCSIFQRSVADIQGQVQQFMVVTKQLEHSNQERVHELHDSMAEPLQSLPESSNTREMTSSEYRQGSGHLLSMPNSTPEIERPLMEEALQLLRSSDPSYILQAEDIAGISDVEDTKHLLHYQMLNMHGKRWNIVIGGHSHTLPSSWTWSKMQCAILLSLFSSVNASMSYTLFQGFDKC